MHVDLYRLETPSDFDELGLNEPEYEESVLVIEWGTKFVPENWETLLVQINNAGQDSRIIDVVALSGAWAMRVAEMESLFGE